MIDVPFMTGEPARWLEFLLDVALVGFFGWILLRLVRALEARSGEEPREWNLERGFRRLVLVIVASGATVFLLRGILPGDDVPAGPTAVPLEVEALSFWGGVGAALAFALTTCVVAGLMRWVVRGFTEEDEWEQYAFPQDVALDEQVPPPPAAVSRPVVESRERETDAGRERAGASAG